MPKTGCSTNGQVTLGALPWARGGRAASARALDFYVMRLSPNFSLVASMTKHDLAGIVLAVVAAALLIGAGTRFAMKAVKGVLALVVVGVLAAVVAVLLFTRAI